MLRETKEMFLERLQNEKDIDADILENILEQLQSGEMTEDDVSERYGLSDDDVERIINQFGYNEPDDLPEPYTRDDI